MNKKGLIEKGYVVGLGIFGGALGNLSWSVVAEWVRSLLVEAVCK